MTVTVAVLIVVPSIGKVIAIGGGPVWSTVHVKETIGPVLPALSTPLASKV